MTLEYVSFILLDQIRCFHKNREIAFHMGGIAQISLWKKSPHEKINIGHGILRSWCETHSRLASSDNGVGREEET